MQENNDGNVVSKVITVADSLNSATVIKTDDGAKDGQNKCPMCGSTDITLNVNNVYKIPSL